MHLCHLITLAAVAVSVLSRTLSAANAPSDAAPAQSHIEDNAVRDIGSRRELFVDYHLIAKLDGARLKLHEPRSEGAVLKLDQPWEGPFCGYATVFKDGDRFRIYYRGTTPDYIRGKTIDMTQELTCYAESRDGIHWTRPELGLVEFQGSKKNNIILAAVPECHGFAPFLDTRPGVPANERYKALGPNFLDRATGGFRFLTAWTSADGIQWRRLREEPVIDVKNVPIKNLHLFDCLNLAFWSESEQSYICYFRVWDGVRRIGRTTSKDFITWSPAVLMEQVRDDGGGPKPAPEEHLYTNATTPYFRAPHIYLALPSRFMAGQDALTAEQRKQIRTDPIFRAAAEGRPADVVPQAADRPAPAKGEGFNDMPLLSTRGGNRYDRTFL
ncbi:MAG: hypothetical protein M3463_12860, partial [Verrucomicrobiota bacterium]|nr:hypothetical protein [Verrucomicrobiota bacterium]